MLECTFSKGHASTELLSFWDLKIQFIKETKENVEHLHIERVKRYYQQI